MAEEEDESQIGAAPPPWGCEGSACQLLLLSFELLLPLCPTLPLDWPHSDAPSWSGRGAPLTPQAVHDSSSCPGLSLAAINYPRNLRSGGVMMEWKRSEERREFLVASCGGPSVAVPLTDRLPSWKRLSWSCRAPVAGGSVHCWLMTVILGSINYRQSLVGSESGHPARRCKQRRGHE